MLLEENKGPLIAFRVATFFRTEVNWRQQIGMILGQSDVTRLTESLSGLQVWIIFTFNNDKCCLSTMQSFLWSVGDPSVVYFNQQTGVSHTIWRSKLSFLDVLTLFSITKGKEKKHFFAWKTLKKHISKSVWHVQHPNAGQNIQHPFTPACQIHHCGQRTLIILNSVHPLVDKPKLHWR